MTLVRAGDLIINFEQVVAIRDLQPHGAAGLSVHTSSGLKLEIVNPELVSALLDWLEQHAEVVPPPVP
jgi:hypothetical protein